MAVNWSRTKLIQRGSVLQSLEFKRGSQIQKAFPSKGLKVGDWKASKIQSPQLLSFDDVKGDLSFPTESCLPQILGWGSPTLIPVRELQTLCHGVSSINLRWGDKRKRERETEGENICHISDYGQPFLNFLRASRQCKNKGFLVDWLVLVLLRRHAAIQTNPIQQNPLVHALD